MSTPPDTMSTPNRSRLPPSGFPGRGRSFAPQMPPEEAPWDLWSKRRYATLGEAVVLSCGLNPEYLPPESINDDYNRAPRDKIKELQKRLNIANDRIEEFMDGVRVSRALLPVDCSSTRIELRRFGTWAVEMEFDLPHEFPRVLETEKKMPAQAISKGSKEDDNQVVVKLPYVSKRLNTLLDTFREHCSNGKRPDNKSLAMDIDKALGWKSKERAASSTATAIAGLLLSD